jgi:signal transduction histidine kinase
VLVVKDNGRGLEPAPGKPAPDRISSGNGLRNMRQRLERIGGRCEISGGDSGTSVSFIVAAHDRRPSSDTPILSSREI